MKTIKIPDCMHPAFELILNGIPYRYPAGQTVTVPDEIAALIAAHSEHHDSKYLGQEVQPPFRSDNIAEAPVLEEATEQTYVLVEHNGKTMRLPLSGLGGSGGTTIHFVGSLPGEIDPSEVDTKYKIGDLFFVTDKGESGYYELTNFDTESDPGLVFPVFDLRCSLAGSGDGYETDNPSADPDAPTALERVHFREWPSDGSYLLGGYGPTITKYGGSLYFSKGNFVEGTTPDDDSYGEDLGWTKLG